MHATAQVLEALEEIAFHPQFSASRIEKERKAVLAEAQVRGRSGSLQDWQRA